MKYLLTFCLAVLFCAPTQSQVALDSLVPILIQRDEIPALRQLLKKTAQQSWPDSTLAKIQFLEVLLAEEQGQGQIEQAYLHALSQLRKYLPPQHPYILRCLNNLGSFYIDKGQYPKAADIYQKRVELLESQAIQDSLNFSWALSNWALSLDYLGKYDQAEALYLRVLDIRRQTPGPRSYEYSSALNNLAAVHRTQGKYRLAEKRYLECRSIRAEIKGRQDPSYASVCNNLGNLYTDLDQLQQAKRYYQEALTIQAQKLEENPLAYASTLNNLGNAYFFSQDYVPAERYFRQALALKQAQLGPLHPSCAGTNGNLARIYLKQKQYSKALPILQENLKIYEKAEGKQGPRYALSLDLLVSLYVQTQELDQALQLAQQSYALYEQTWGRQHPQSINSQYVLGQIYHKKGQHDQALQAYQQAMLAYHQKLPFQDIPQLLPAILQLLQQEPSLYAQFMPIFFHWYQLRKTMQQRGQLSLSSTDQKAIEQLALQLNQTLPDYYLEEEDQLRLLANNRDWVLEALRQQDSHQDIQRSFELAELGRATLLRQGLQSRKIHQFGEVPDSLLRQEQQLKQQLSQLKAQYQQQQNANLPALQQTEEQLQQLKQQFKQEYPRYYALRYQMPQIQVAQIQKQLNPQTALLEYVLGDSVVYLFLLQDQTIELYQFPISSDSLQAQIIRLRQSLSDYTFIQDQAQQAYDQYTQTAFWCYEQLLAPALRANPKLQHLIIIPDAVLGHIPFETFLTSPVQGRLPYRQLPYLLKQYSISYDYAAALWLEHRRQTINQNNGLFLGIAAQYPALSADSSPSRRNLLQPLPAARQEVEALAQRFRGDFIWDSLGHEAFFKQKANQYGIIHLAMHGLVNTKEPMLSALAFTAQGQGGEDDFLQAYEISRLSLQANLVVLSACETGYGRLAQGEGVLSLARAFMYAGVPSLVVSQWEVNDAATAYVMQYFYEYLAQGQDKAEALRQAKLRYLEQVEDLAAHPAYWSAFIQLGDSRPIPIFRQTRSWAVLWYIAPLVLLLLLAVWRYGLRTRA